MPYVGRQPSAVPVTADDIPANSIDASKIIDGAIAVADVADNAITDAKIADATIVNLKSGRKNLIINGAMQVAQRGTSVADVSSGSVKNIDRFMNEHDVSYYTLLSEQSTDAPDGFRHSHKVSVTGVTGTKTSSSYLIPFETRLENNILTPLSSGTSSAKEMTLSFWVKSNDTGTKSVDMYYQSLSGWVGDRSKNKAFTINSADTWEKKVLTFPANTTITDTSPSSSSTNGMTIWWWMSANTAFTSGTEQSSWGSQVSANRAAGVSDNATTGTYYQITGVQLELGSVATDFEHRSYGEELALCQRYYERSENNAGIVWVRYSNDHRFNTQFTVTKRATPTITTNSDYSVYSTSTAYTLTNASTNNVNTASFRVQFNSSNTNSSGYVNGFDWTADAEL